MSAAAPFNRTFSPARAVFHAVIPVVVLVVVCVVIGVSMSDGAAVAKFSEAIGRFSVYLFAFGFGISYLAQTRAAWIAWLVGIAVGAVVIWGLLVGVGQRARLGAGGGPATRLGMPAALRVPLVEGADGRIRHPVLGFSFDKPAGFVESTAQNTSPGNGAMLYTYVNRKSGDVLIACMMFNVPRTRAEMQEMLNGVINGIVKQAIGQFPVTFTEQRVEWTEQVHQATAEAKLGEAQLSFRASVIEPRNAPPVVVGLVGIGRQNDAWFPMTLGTWKPNGSPVGIPKP